MPRFELDDLAHRAREIGPLPIVKHFLDRLGVVDLLTEFVPDKKLGRRLALSNARTLAAMVSNIMTSREPLYAVPQWFAMRVSEHAGIDEGEAHLLNDDRIGRALDRLFKADHATLMTSLVVRAVREFKVDLSQTHSDTTTVTFSGDYATQRSKDAVGRPPLITFGHNKDHRPDLKQLVYSLAVSADGAVPVHYKLYDGNKTDDKVHLDTWNTIRSIAGRPDFVYVADSKLCTRENMDFIAGQGGLFVTVLARSRREDDAFREHVQRQAVAWEEVRREPGNDPDGPPRVWEAFDGAGRSAEGYRVIWYRSSIKRALDEERRTDRIARAKLRIETLEGRTGSHRFRSIDAATKAADQVLRDEGAQPWLRVRVVEASVADFKQVTPGRPGKVTTYRRDDIPIILFQVEEIVDAIRADAKCDGLFAMVTNHDKLTPQELLSVYKYQPFLEKRNEQLKSVLAVAPVFLKKPDRVASLLFLYFVALLVFALIEREARQRMQSEGVASLPLYPEDRACRAPTCDGILRLFERLRRTDLVDSDGRVVRSFFDPLSPVAKQVLKLLGVPAARYEK